MTQFTRHDGYYDQEGNWQRTKLCSVDCGERCTCKPPFGIWHFPPPKKKEEEKKPDESST